MPHCAWHSASGASACAPNLMPDTSGPLHNTYTLEVYTYTLAQCQVAPRPVRPVLVHLPRATQFRSRPVRPVLVHLGRVMLFHMTHAHMAVREVVTGLVPSVGPEHGSSLVRVQGHGFQRSPQLSCMFGSQVVSAAWNSDTEVECLSMALPAGTTLDVRVANNGIDFSVSSAQFSFKGSRS